MQEKIQYHTGYNGERKCILNKGEVPYITFPAFSKYSFLFHGFSTRQGGVSKGALSSMNLSYSRGDEDTNVDENYRRICQAMGVQPETLVFSDQVHKTRIAYADGSVKKYMETDGLITDKRGLVLCTSYADCVPLYFADAAGRGIGLAHSGWRGTVERIGAKTVAAMEEQFGCPPSDLTAVIGPSICPDCYEISQDVADAFKEQFTKVQAESFLTAGECKDSQDEPGRKYRLNLWEANKIILSEAGLRPENIHIAGLCTCCNPNILFSHRASGGKRGNLNAFLGIR